MPTANPATCAKCHAPLGSKTIRCVYCGLWTPIATETDKANWKKDDEAKRMQNVLATMITNVGAAEFVLVLSSVFENMAMDNRVRDAAGALGNEFTETGRIFRRVANHLGSLSYNMTCDLPK